jgi:hypothetical protein
MEQWVKRDACPQRNKPLVIEGEVGVGKKSLLNKWKHYHLSKQRNDIVLVHYATAGGSNANFFFAIYRTLIKLRELLNISQKVELHEEKLRRYLAYWLEVCDRSIESQAINNVDQQYEKVILIFEGVNYFVDRDSQREGNISFWLPITFPAHIRVIISVDKGSHSLEYLKQINCEIITLSTDEAILRSVIDAHLRRPSLLDHELKRRLAASLAHKVSLYKPDCLFVKTFLTTLLPEADCGLDPPFLNKCLAQLNFKLLEEANDLKALIDIVLDFWAGFFGGSRTFGELMWLFVSTQKGLLMPELLRLSELD